MPRTSPVRPDPKMGWLARQPWCRDLPWEAIRELAAAGDRTTVPAGREIMTAGTRGMEAALVVTGTLEVRQDGQVVARRVPGDVIGERSLVTRTHRNATVHTASEVELLVFDLTGFRRLMGSVSAFRDRVDVAVATRG